MNILVISAGGINQPKGGAGNRAYKLAYYLQWFGNKITVLEPGDKKNSKHSIDRFSMHYYFGKIGKRSFNTFCDINPFFIVKFFKLLYNCEVDLVHVEFPWGVSAAKIIAKLLRKDVPVIYNSHNIQKKVQRDLRDYYTKNRSSIETLLIHTLLCQYTNIVEKLAVRLSDLVLCTSQNDTSLFTNEYGVSPDKLKVIPNGTNCDKIITATESTDKHALDNSKINVVFHGSGAYPPNTEAIALIENVIAPDVLSQATNVQFIIAGYGTEEVCHSSSTICLGYVDNIYSLLKSCDIAIVPIISGGGTRLKILDCFASGLAVVTTKKGIEGIEAINGEHVIIVDEVNKEFIKALRCLINNEQERERIGKNAVSLAKEYDWKTIGYRLNRLYSELLMAD